MGTLHASAWAMIGSSNLTNSGFSTNVERRISPSFPLTTFRELKIDLEHNRLWVVSKFFTKDIEAAYIQGIGFDAQPNLNV